MAESDGAWGDLAEHDDELAEVWDGYDRLPDPGGNDVLDAFVESKRIDIPSLVRLGTRLAQHDTLAFHYPGGIKYRNMLTGKRWSTTGAAFTKLKIIQAGAPSDTVIVCEGETDAARLTLLYDCDVAALPAGAKRFTKAFAAQLEPYGRVLVGLDNDAAGNAGHEKIAKLIPRAIRFLPGDANDWCSLEGEQPDIPAGETANTPTIVFGGDLMDLELPEATSWLEQALLPIGGQMIVHGPPKSFKTFLALDLLAALAQCQDWAGFEAIEEPTKVCAIQYEVPPPYYRARIQALRANAKDRAAFDANFGTWTPLQRPTLRAGEKAEEDKVLAGLLEAGVQIVLFDPIRRALGPGNDMNSEADVRQLLGFFERLQDEGITVVATHHDNKAAMRHGGGDPWGMTGSGAFAGDADTIVSISLPKGDTVDSPRRNISFLSRNAASPSTRGMAIQEDGHLKYATSPYGEGHDDTPDEPVI